MKDEQFDPRYKLPPRQSADPGARKRARRIASIQRDTLSGLNNRPPGIDWFVSVLESGPEPGVLQVGYFCAMAPVELIEAFGARAIRIGCGNAALVQPGEEVLSGEICPLAKSSFAEFLDPDGPRSKLTCVISPTSCDAKRKLGDVISDFKPVFMLNLPPEQDYARFRAMAVGELERMAAFLERTLKVKFSKSALLDRILQGRKRTAVIRELSELRSADPGIMSVRDLMVIVQSSYMGAAPDEWLTRASEVLAWARTASPGRKRVRPRLVLTGAPMIWPNFKPLNLIEECGADVVADTLCSGVGGAFDPVVVTEKSTSALLSALAQRYIFGSACPCFISPANRISRVLDLVHEHRADGVLHYGLRLCQLFDIELYRLSALLKERKIPFMNLRTDYSLEDTEQLRVRLEAFLETLEG